MVSTRRSAPTGKADAVAPQQGSSKSLAKLSVPSLVSQQPPSEKDTDRNKDKQRSPVQSPRRSHGITPSPFLLAEGEEGIAPPTKQLTAKQVILSPRGGRPVTRGRRAAASDATTTVESPAKAHLLAGVPLPEDDGAPLASEKAKGGVKPPKRVSFAVGLLYVFGVAWLATLSLNLIALPAICRYLPGLAPRLPQPFVQEILAPLCALHHKAATSKDVDPWSLIQLGLSDIASGVSEITSDWQKAASDATLILRERYSDLSVVVKEMLGKLCEAGKAFPPRLLEHAVADLRQRCDQLLKDLWQFLSEKQIQIRTALLRRPAVAPEDLLPPSSDAPPPDGEPLPYWRLLGAVLESAAGTEAFSHREDAWHAIADLAVSKRKAVGMLMTCEVQSGCDAAVQRLGAVASGSLVVDLNDLAAGPDAAADAPGMLQDLLAHEAEAAAAAFPPRVIVLLNLDQATSALLSVINNVLSEGGSLELDGSPVSTAGVMALFPMRMPLGSAPRGGSSVEDLDGELERAAKDELCSRLEARLVGAPDEGAEEASRAAAEDVVVKAFRRRIDIVFPAPA